MSGKTLTKDSKAEKCVSQISACSDISLYEVMGGEKCDPSYSTITTMATATRNKEMNIHYKN
jgi:hypothetical protein